MSARDQATALPAEDERLVDLVSAVLVDPNLHTDERLRLHQEITELLRSTREDLPRPPSPRTRPEVPEVHANALQSLLTSVLVDPNLHTDLRMRLHEEIREVLGGAALEDPSRASPAGDEP